MLDVCAHQQVESQSLVNFLPLDINDEDSVAAILSHADNAIQYGEDLEPKDPDVSIPSLRG